MMKNLKLIIGTVIIFGGLLLLTSCSNNANIDKLLQNETTRQEVFNKIASNKDMMSGFMNVMMNNESSKMMMMNNKGMKGMMMDKGNMMQMMNNNPEMMKTMMSNMMKDKNMMGNMMQMMHDKGMMSEECMQSCMKMMGDKGMNMMGDKGMNMMNGGDKMKERMTNEDHKSHH
jgi:outer membrane murein-binding lipoprotein Lpp